MFQPILPTYTRGKGKIYVIKNHTSSVQKLCLGMHLFVLALVNAFLHIDRIFLHITRCSWANRWSIWNIIPTCDGKSSLFLFYNMLLWKIIAQLRSFTLNLSRKHSCFYHSYKIQEKNFNSIFIWRMINFGKSF